MPSLQVNNDPNVLAGKLLDVLRHANHRLGLDELQNLEDTVSNIIALVKNGVNSYACINTLPAEILGMVFMHTLPSRDGDLRLSGYKDPVPKEDLRARVVLTHVCRQWRQVALDMALLWTLINASSNSSSAFLSHSREMPLQVLLRYAHDQGNEQTLGPHGERIRDLAITIGKEHRSVIPSESPEFAFDAPNLESLSLITQCRPFDDSRPNIDFELSSHLFSQPTPHLRMLILRNMCWLPNVPYESLTHLNLTGGTPIFLASFLDFLKRCSSLEELVVVDIYIANSMAVPLDHAISMPRLRQLVLGINQPLLSMRRLLQYLILPPTVTLRVTGAQSMKALNDLHPFPSLPFTQTFDTLSIDNPIGSLVVRASGPFSGLLFDPKDYNLVRSEQALRLMKCLIPFDRITDLRYGTDIAQVGRGMLLLAESPMPSLRRLSFVDTSGIRPPNLWCDALLPYTQAISEALGRAPQLCELELWSSDRDFPLRLGLPGSAPALSRLVFHYTGACVDAGDGGENGENGEADKGSRGVVSSPHLTLLRECGLDVRVCTSPGHSTCGSPLKIPGVDPLSHPYEW